MPLEIWGAEGNLIHGVLEMESGNLYDHLHLFIYYLVLLAGIVYCYFQWIAPEGETSEEDDPLIDRNLLWIRFVSFSPPPSSSNGKTIRLVMKMVTEEGDLMP